MSTRVNSPNWTPQMQAAVAEMTAAATRIANSNQKQSALQSVLTSWADALGDLGQNSAAFALLVGCGVATGAGIDAVAVANSARDYGLGVGLVVAGSGVGARVLLDLLLGELFELVPRREEKTKEQIRPQSIPVEMEMGLQVPETYGGGWVTLLPDLPRHQVLKMAKITAAEFFGGRVEKNFSQRYLGRVWGDYLNKAKEQLAAVGHIELGGNKTYTFTDSGIEWLERAVTER